MEAIQYKNLQWVHLNNPTEEDYSKLISDYHFHKLDIDDCHSTNQRPKIDEYDSYYFLILHFPYFDRNNRNIHIHEVKIFWGKEYVITIGKSNSSLNKVFNDMRDCLSQGNSDINTKISSSDILLYHILDRLVSESYSIVMRVGDEVDKINYDILNNKSRNIIEHISTTRRNVILLNTTFKAQLRILHLFESGSIKGFTHTAPKPNTDTNSKPLDMEDYWGNILDQYQKMFDSIEDYGELTEGLSKTFDSLQTNRTNEIIRIMTFFSTIMLPLTVITGMLGMNIAFPFQTTGLAFWVVCLVMALVSAILFCFFNWKLKIKK